MWRKHQDSLSDTASEPGGSRIGFSGPMSGPLSGPLGVGKKPGARKSARFKEEEAYVEITLDVRDESVAVQNVKGGGADAAALARRMERRSSSFGSQFSSKIRQVSRELKRMTSSSAGFDKFDRTKSGAARALKGLQFISKNVGGVAWPEVERKFDELSVDDVLHRSKFGKCIGMEGSEEFAGELFDALARRRAVASTTSVSKAQLRDFWEILSDESFDARIQIFFDMVDTNADGRISAEEVKEIITLSASANKLSKLKDDADEYAALIMEELDPDNLGYIEMYNLQTLLLEAPQQKVLRGAQSAYLSQMLSQKLVPTREPNPLRRLAAAAGDFLEDNWKRLWVLFLWAAACAALFAWKFIQYRRRAVFHVMGYCVAIAKGGAETTKLNMALILLPVCRNTITWLRSRTPLGSVVPFDDNINFHKVLAGGVALGVGLHAISHLTCDFPRLLHASDEKYEPMKRFFGDQRPNNYWWFVKGKEGWTGVAMVVLMVVAYVLAQPWFRRNRLAAGNPLRKLTGFNAFWYSHHLFAIVYVLFVLHGQFLYLTKEWYKKTTWMYLAIPLLLYTSERMLRAFRSSYKPAQILKVAVYPGNVLTIHMTKPNGFNYSSGQYIFVNCSAVSPLQWHPFSITSAPGDDFISLHIQTAGDWTKQLKDVFSKVCYQPTGDQSGLLRADVGKGDDSIGLPRLLIDGPYGAPAQDYKKYDVLLLVGLGIGATPMISILKDVMNNIKHGNDAVDVEEREEGSSSSKKKKKKKSGGAFAVKRAYFYWVTREQGSFEWFRGVMDDVAENDRDGVIELHNYCTSVYEEGDARSALILMLQSLNHAKNGVDIVSGTRVRTHFARPNWRAVYKHVAVRHSGQRVGVFYCGKQVLVPELRQLAKDFSHRTDTKFEFHKENF